MEHRVGGHGSLGRIVEDTVGLQVDHLVASSDANYGTLNATGIYVLLDKVVDVLQSFSRHPDLCRTAGRQLASCGHRRIQSVLFGLRFD